MGVLAPNPWCEEEDARLASRRDVVETAMMAVDELLSELAHRGRGLTCPTHRARRIPTLCPICAIAECRSRQANNFRRAL